MTDVYAYNHAPKESVLGVSHHGESTLHKVMVVLHEIRSCCSDGKPYEDSTNLADAGFTSVEMVKVMLGIEAAFDVMIPQDMITPENFATPRAIATMMSAV